jgi:hypothetical protein
MPNQKLSKPPRSPRHPDDPLEPGAISRPFLGACRRRRQDIDHCLAGDIGLGGMCEELKKFATAQTRLNTQLFNDLASASQVNKPCLRDVGENERLRHEIA